MSDNFVSLCRESLLQSLFIFSIIIAVGECC